MKRILAAYFLGVLFFMSASPVFAQGSATADKATGAQKDSMCWTVEQCQERYAAEATGNPDWVFATDSFVSEPEECDAANLGYCYAPTISYDLIIDLGAVTSVKGLGGYIEVIYSLAIVMGTIGVVLSIMIAGLRWMVARGDAGAVGAAKEMIGKAIVSMVILLSIVTLANLVDPSLTVLNPLRVPLIKQVNYIPQGSSCETLRDIHGYTIKQKEGLGECGDKGVVDALPKGDSTVIGAEVGDECFYTACTDRKASCIQRTGETPTCMLCSEFVSETGISASASTCSAFGRGRVLSQGQMYNCAYFPPESTLDSLLEIVSVKNSGFCAEVQYPGDVDVPVIDCKRMQVTANGNCGIYDDISMTTSSAIVAAGNWTRELRTLASYSSAGLSLFTSYCAQDICNAATSECKVIDTREYVDTPANYRCVSVSTPTPPVPTRPSPEVPGR